MFTNPECFKNLSQNETSAELWYRIVRMSRDAKSAHLSTALSCGDILTTLYFGLLNVQPSQPD